MLKKIRPTPNGNGGGGADAQSSSPSSTSSNLWDNDGGMMTTTTTTTTTMMHEEVRPLVPWVRRDLGEDYWIDPADLERERQREADRLLRMRSRRGQKGSNDDGDDDEDQVTIIPAEKLWTEVKAPYRQNWIGYFSVVIAVLTVIVLQFPELLETPTIRIPDL
jgi:hypothetical protein